MESAALRLQEPRQESWTWPWNVARPLQLQTSLSAAIYRGADFQSAKRRSGGSIDEQVLSVVHFLAN